jgi:hypothetical protein
MGFMRFKIFKILNLFFINPVHPMNLWLNMFCF